MAYEYESRLKNRLLDLEFDTWEETAQCEREYRELERVYRKAKAFDEVIKKVKTEFVSEDLADAIHILVNDYEYDKEDKQYGL
ncbi:hypothetical protein [Staphylococcus equorum]|uniref:hypothetical protein n=1 Tax=Staphylococcus equorum TaxID=246432 RepID=UPI003FD70991